MHKVIEFQGKTVENALENASIELKMLKNEIKYEVITYGSTGIFGLIGVKKAVIRVTINKSEEVQDENTHTFLSDRNKIRKLVNETLDIDDNIPSKTLEIGQAVLQRIVNAITDGANIEVYKQNRQITFEIKGGASGILIGKKGQTLEAIQYIVEKIVNKNSDKRVRVLIDVENYLKKKRENLQRLANKLVDKVKRTKKPVTIGQMNAHDRRIIHTYLKNECDVRTQSVGSGYYRKLMIFPQKQKSRKFD